MEMIFDKPDINGLTINGLVPTYGFNHHLSSAIRLGDIGRRHTMVHTPRT